MGFFTRGRNNVPVYNRKKILCLCLGGLILAAASVVIALIDPIAIIARYHTRIAKGSNVYNLLHQRLDGALVESYLFNITNSERFLSGADYELKVEEVGPFTYQESRRNLNIELDENEGLLSYTPETGVNFLPERSIADPKHVNVTLPNIALISMASTLSSYSSYIQYGFNILVRRIKAETITNLRAFDYLWGYDEPLLRFANTLLPGFVNFSKLGILDRLYDKKMVNRLVVGATDADKFQIKTLNGIKGLKALHYEDPEKRTTCNTFVDAYEGFAYTPGVTPNSRLRIWRNVICRMLELDYVDTRLVESGAEALVYKISNRTYDYGPDKQCLCKEEEVCYNGLSDLSSCFLGLPLAISNAHFFGGEPKLFSRIVGLNPDEKKHGSEFLVEPTVGMVLGTRFTVQMNIIVKDVNFSPDTRSFTDMVVPIAYFKIIQPELKPSQLRDIKLIWVTGPKIILTIEIILFVTGVMMIAYAMRQVMWNVSLWGETRAMEFTLNESEKQMQVNLKSKLAVLQNY